MPTRHYYQPEGCVENLIAIQNVINDQKDKMLEKNKRPESNKGDQVGQIVKN